MARTSIAKRSSAQCGQPDMALADRALIEACALFMSCEDLYAALVVGDEDDPRLNDMQRRIDQALALICRVPARTQAGIRAKATALHFQIRRYVLDAPTEPEDDLAWSLVNDIIGRV